MKARPVTLVIPNYNGAQFLGETIDSLLKQTFANFLLVVLDGGSTDDSVEVARAFVDPRLSVVASRDRVPMAENWNRAASLVETPYFVLAHNDDIYEATYLEEMLALIEGTPDAFMAHCRARYVDGDGQVIHTRAESYKDALWPAEEPWHASAERDFALLSRANVVIAPTAIFRTSAFRAVGLFDERYEFVTDWDYWLRGLLANYSMIGTRRRLVRWRRHGRTATRATEQTLRRFREEIALSKWVAQAARERGLSGPRRPDYSLPMNTIMSEFAARLTMPDRPGALALYDLACDDIPGFRNSLRAIVMQAALAMGRTGGRVLRGAEAAYLSVQRGRAALAGAVARVPVE